MAFPPALPPGGRTDATPAAGAHAADHNATAAALAAILAELGTDPSGADLDLAARLARFDAALSQFQAVTPTIDELVGSQVITTWQSGTNPPTGQSGTQLSSLWIAPFPCKIVAMTLSWDYYNRTADDANYVNIFFRKINASTVTFVSKNTRVTGGEPIVARTPWRYSGAAWDTGVATFAEGDILGMQVALNGSATMQFPMTVTWRYVPL